MAQKPIIKQSRKENPFSIPIVDKTNSIPYPNLNPNKLNNRRFRWPIGPRKRNNPLAQVLARNARFAGGSPTPVSR